MGKFNLKSKFNFADANAFQSALHEKKPINLGRSRSIEREISVNAAKFKLNLQSDPLII